MASPPTSVQGKIAVVGAGPAGLLSAILYARQNYDVKVFEKRQAPVRGGNATTERTIIYSINMRGIHALKQADVWLPDGTNPAREKASGLQLGAGLAARIVGPSGKVSYRPPRILSADVVRTERRSLVAHMLDEAERYPDRIAFEMPSTIQSVDIPARAISYTSSHGSTHKEQFDLIIGADGRNSMVREAMQAANPNMKVNIVPQEAYYISFCGLQPVGQKEWDFVLEGKPTGMFGLGPKREFDILMWRSISTDTISGLISTSEARFKQLHAQEDFERAISAAFDYLPKAWVPQIAAQLVGVTPSLSGATIKCSPFTAPGAAIIGDACHAVSPTFGQGVNAALESSCMLAQAIESCKHNIPAALSQFERERKLDVHALYALDVHSAAMFGKHRFGRLNQHYIVNMFHTMVWSKLSQRFPQVFKPPALIRLQTMRIPYREVIWSLKRDRILALIALLAMLAATGQALRITFLAFTAAARAVASRMVLLSP